MTRRPAAVLPLGPAPLRILTAAIHLTETGQPLTIPTLCAVTGRSRCTVHHHLRRLRRSGLIDWANHTHGTIHLTVRRVR